MEQTLQWLLGIGAVGAVVGVLYALLAGGKAGKSVDWRKVLETIVRRVDNEVHKTHTDVPKSSDQELADRFNKNKAKKKGTP